MNKCFIIAEAGVNHNGSEEMAMDLIDIASSAGADAVKFQTFRADNLVQKGTKKADYQAKCSEGDDQYTMLKRLELSEELHLKLIKRCRLKHIEFMSTAFDEESVDFLLEHGMKRVKIPSGEITNHIFIRHVASKNVPIIMSTGMATMCEVQEAKQVIEDERKKHGFKKSIENVLTILHCTSNYPASPKDVNLRAMTTISRLTSVPVGYSDHTLGTAVSVGAVAMGASTIEKHFTKSRQLPGPDHSASLEPAELRDMISDIRIMSQAMGSDKKHPTESEMPIRELTRRSIGLLRDLKEGDIISADDIVLKRPGTGIPPKLIDKVVGMRAARDLFAGDMLDWPSLEQ